MMIRDRDTLTRAHGRVGSTRFRRTRWIALALVAALALAGAATGPASAATPHNIPGYNQAQVNRAISAVAKTTSALRKALHPHRKHRRRHGSRHA
jgi:hypothetical protein